MKSIGLVINRSKPGALRLAKTIQTWLKTRKKTVLSDGAIPLRQMLSRVDMVICLGGDGTLLYTAGHLPRQVPVMGVNLGSFGFLTGVKKEEVLQELEDIFRGKLVIEERIMLEAVLLRGKRKKRYQGLNDVVISREGTSSHLRVRVSAGKEALMAYPGDGVIVATPTGSTAYSLSAGGPFVYPTQDCLLVTPLCAHSLLSRPIVLPSEKEIEVRAETDKKGAKAALTVDGQKKHMIGAEDIIRITRSPLRMQLISSSQRSYLETLREKFWMVGEKRV